MRIKITENQLKRINELEVVQYEDNSSETKNLNSPLELAAMYDYIGLPLPGNNWEARDVVATIDYSITLNTNANGYKLLGKVHRVSGYVLFDNYNDNYDKIDSKKIDISNYNIVSLNIFEKAEFDSTSLSFKIDFSKKIITF